MIIFNLGYFHSAE